MAFKDFWDSITNTPDTTADFDPQDIEANKITSVLAYIGVLVIVPFVKKDSKFAQFHANQGLVFLISIIVFYVAMAFLAFLFAFMRLGFIISIVSWLGSVTIFFLAVCGILNAYNGKAKELPLIGKIRIIK